jgi:hypothetical protein
LGLLNFNAQGIVARLSEKDVAIDGEIGNDTVRFVELDGLHIQLSSTDYAMKQAVYRLRK